jgi:NitT/TauT family transport system ATP-binding protein/nitrate/nitrite transport system substrate-binding protein
MTTETIRLGLLRLCDAAPVILAAHEGMFAADGLDVQLVIEPSWANVADKLSYGLLDGAVMLPPLALACAAGLRGRATPLVVPMSLSSNGNAVTLATGLREDFAAGGIPAVAARGLRLAVVHAFSTHDLLLRYWLAAAGVDAARDVEITVLPPSDMPARLAEGRIDGFCAGAPWGEAAAAAGCGFIAQRSRDIWHNHPEKCLALRARFWEAAPEAGLALVRILRAAAALCADPARLPHIATLLGDPAYLDLPAALLADGLAPAAGGPDFSRQYPDPRHAEWFTTQMRRWHDVDATAAVSIYRPDVFLAAGGREEG